jgi:hypothetical protein
MVKSLPPGGCEEGGDEWTSRIGSVPSSRISRCIQDYLGRNPSTGGIKTKNEWVHSTHWDCVILDEYHYGAWRQNAKELFEAEDKIATLTVSGLTWGTHSIVASYSGDHQFEESNSPAVLQRVKHGWTDLQHIWSSIQSFVTILAIIAAGAWALHKWFAERIPSLEMKITAQQQDGNPNDGLVIRGKINVKNVGNQPAVLVLEDGPLFVAKIESIFSGAPKDTGKDTAKQHLGKILFAKSKKFWLSRPSVDEPRRPDYENFDEIRPGATDVFYFINKSR